MTDEPRRCKHCDLPKPIEEFVKSSYVKKKTGERVYYPLHICKSCHSIQLKQYTKKPTLSKPKVEPKPEAPKKYNPQDNTGLSRWTGKVKQHGVVDNTDADEMYAELLTLIPTHHADYGRAQEAHKRACSQDDYVRPAGRGVLFALYAEWKSRAAVKVASGTHQTAHKLQNIS